MEGPKLVTNEKITNGDRKLALKTEFGALRHDWFKSKGINIEGKGYSEIKKAIGQFYTENSGVIKEAMEATEVDMETELGELSVKNLDFRRLAEVRKKLNLPKYVSLSEAVAFIKTAMDLSDDTITERYAEYCASGISLDDMRNTLAYENDVKPVRLDTDIYHQSPERTRSAVEIVSNAIDAMNKTGITIGRFGVGFYQILSHLKEGDDYVKVTTGNEETGFYEISFKLEGKEIKFHLQEVKGERNSGTTVELHVKDFPKDEAETLVKKHFAFNSGAKVKCNGEQVNNLDSFGVDQSKQNTADIKLTEYGFQVTDTGIGMSPQVILEKLLVPKISGKKPIQEMMDLDIQPTYIIERGGDKSFTGGKVVVNVGGVVIEEIPLTGINVLKTLVIDLPPFTLLGEERNQVAVDEITIKAMKKVIDNVVQGGDFQTINSLAPIVNKLQGRSMNHHEGNNLSEYLNKKAGELLPDINKYFPNISGFERLDIRDAVFLDPDVRQTNWNTIPEIFKPNMNESGGLIFIAPLTDSIESPLIRWRNRIIFSQKLYDKYRDDPTVINIFLEAFEHGNDLKLKRLADKQEKISGIQLEAGEKKEYKDFSQFVVENWRALGFKDKNTAELLLSNLNNEKYFIDLEGKVLSESLIEEGRKEQQRLLQLVHKYIIVNFPEYYARYFVDAVLYNQIPPLTEENLANFATLARCAKLPVLLSDLMIYPIVSREEQIDHFDGIGFKPKLSDPYDDMSYCASTDEQRKEEGVWGTRDHLYGERDNNIGKWYTIHQWDRENLVHIGGEVFPGEATHLNRSGMFFVRDGRKYYMVNERTRERIDIDYRFKFDIKKSYQFHEFPFGNQELVEVYCGEFLSRDRRRMEEYIFGDRDSSSGEGFVLFDVNNRTEFNPRPELGEIIDYVNSDKKEYRSFAVEHTYLLYEKTVGVKKKYFAYFPDDTWEEVFTKDECIPERMQKDIKEKGTVERGDFYKSSFYTGSAYGDKNYRREIGYIPGKDMLVAYGKMTFDKNGKPDNYPSSLALIKKATELSEVKANAVYRVLESSSVESEQKHRRFLNRIFKYSYLSDQAFNYIADVLLEVDDIEPSVLQEDLISETEVRLAGYDKDAKIWFYRLLVKMVDDEWNKDELNVFFGKFVRVYIDKVLDLSNSEKESMFKIFNEARVYGKEYIVNGWNIIKYKTPIPTQQIPESIRPIVDFLRSDEKTMFGKSREEIAFAQSSQFTLSQLIQAKRLNETQIRGFNGNTAELEQLVKEKVEGKKQDHIQREIIHPIYYQSVNNPYLFIRELVQNAHDVVIQNRLKSKKDKSVTIDIFSRKEESVTLRIEDHVGMSLGEVLNYFLIPGETTKIGQKDVIGYFGQGLFTLFRGAKEAVLKTSKGDGFITKLKIIPKLDDKGMVSDLDLTIEQEEGDFKGTIIERTVDTEYPTVEGAYIKNATATFTSLVDGNVVDIYMNGQRLNDKQIKLASIDVPGVGEMQIFDAPNNVITQRGLFVKSVDSDFNTEMHDVEAMLEHRGYVLNIPDDVRLTRSRNEIAQKQETLEKIKAYLPTLKVKAYIEIFRQDIIRGHVIQLKDLPSDYFYQDYNPSQKLANDAEKIRKGQSLDDVSPYLERSSLISLLVLLPVVEIGSKSYSLAELKAASLTDAPPLSSERDYEQIPAVIRNRLLDGKKEHGRIQSAMSQAEMDGRKVPDFSINDWQRQPEFIKEQVQKQLDEYGNMSKLTDRFNEITCRSFGDGRSVETTFYNAPGSKAHATQGFGGLGWNLEYWKGWNIRMFGQKNPSDHELKNFLDVWSHEFGHILEESGFTHNPKFYRRQAEALSRFMYEREVGLTKKSLVDKLNR